MTEFSHSHEPRQPEVKRVRLKRGEMGKAFVDLSRGHPSEGFNGDVVATLEFPPEVGHISKRVAVIDYGEDFADKNILPDFIDNQGNVHKLGGLGRPRTRYGLRAENYEADDHMLTYAPLPQGEEVVLGREETHGQASHMLGLTELTAGNKTISRKHVSLMHDGHSLQVTDLSTHGTVVETYPHG